MPRNLRRTHTLASDQAGFILPLSIMLILMLAISGTSFMQLDYLERRMSTNTVYNHDAFYLANAGIERGRETFKIDTAGSNPTWTPILDGTSPYALQDPPHPVLCVAGKNCVIPVFGVVVESPEPPFEAGFAAGSYAVRAFNDAAEAGNVDVNGILTIRAMGNVGSEQKVLETTLMATSALNLINCSTGTICPSDVNGNPTQDAAPGREPAVGPVPTLDPPLSSSDNYYRQPGNFPVTVQPYAGTIESNSYYLISGDVTIQGVEADNVIIFVEGDLTINTSNNLTNTIFIATGNVTLAGNGTISAPLPHPAIISGADVSKSSGSATVYGAIYAEGTLNLNPIDVHGVLIGTTVEIQGSSTFTDDHETDTNYLKYYALMPGFDYSSELKTNAVIPGSWKELQ